MRLASADWIFDSDTREVTRSGAAVPLSPKAFDLLELLIRRRPKAVSKADIHEHLWPGTFNIVTIYDIGSAGRWRTGRGSGSSRRSVPTPTTTTT